MVILRSIVLLIGQGWAIIFARGQLWEGRIKRRAVPSYGSRRQYQFTASVLVFTMRSGKKFQIWRFSWMLLRAT